jgi:hypothetical protein
MGKTTWHLLIDDRNSYFEKVLSVIKKTIKEQEEKYKIEENRYKVAELNEEDVSEWEDYLGEVSYEQSITQQLLYKSFMVSVFMFMEGKVLELCEHLRKEYKQNFSVYDLKGFGVTASINYIKKVINIDFPKDGKTKNEFAKAKNLRNILVHNDGVLNDIEKQNKFKKRFKNYKGKVYLWNNEVCLEDAYLEDLMLLNEKICKEVSGCWVTKDF